MVIKLEDLFENKLGIVGEYSKSNNLNHFLKNIDSIKFPLNFIGGLFPISGTFEIKNNNKIKFIQHQNKIEYIGTDKFSLMINNGTKAKFYYLPQIFTEPILGSYFAKEKNLDKYLILEPLIFIPRYIKELENKKNSEKIILADFLAINLEKNY